MSGTNEYVYYWNNGKRETLSGMTFMEAFLSAGYTTDDWENVVFWNYSSELSNVYYLFDEIWFDSRIHKSGAL